MGPGVPLQDGLAGPGQGLGDLLQYGLNTLQTYTVDQSSERFSVCERFSLKGTLKLILFFVEKFRSHLKIPPLLTDLYQYLEAPRWWRFIQFLRIVPLIDQLLGVAPPAQVVLEPVPLLGPDHTGVVLLYQRPGGTGGRLHRKYLLICNY